MWLHSWGLPFVEHTFLYHFSRLDHRHNFSQHFYPIYLRLSAVTDVAASKYPGQVVQILARSSFVPQLGLSTLIGFGLGKRGSTAYVCFLQTMVFVSFNRVCTSQYFMWSLWFLPMVLPSLQYTGAGGSAILGLWVAGQAIWLSYGYKLEFLGQAVFQELFVASLLFFLINAGIVCWLLVSYRPGVVKGTARP